MFINMWRDLITAARSLAGARAFTSVCVLSLGIGMAPVIAVPYASRIFTTPPPGVVTDGLVELVTTRVGPRAESDKWSYPDFLDLRAADTGVSVTGWAPGSADVVLQGGGVTLSAEALFVSSNYFDTIGLTLAQGPGFQATNDPAVILGHRFWQRRMAAEPDVIGKTLTVDGVSHAIVGIAPHSFSSHLAGYDAELFLPLERHATIAARNGARFDRSKEWVRIHGRLSPGVAPAQASAAVEAITSHLAKQYPSTNELKAGAVAAYHPLGSIEEAEARIIIAVWQAMTVLPLIVVCLNVSGMVQVRTAMRERDLAIRQAIGASRGRLIQHLLAEAVLLAAVGGTLASVALFNIVPVASWWLDEPLPVRLEAALRVDLPMLAICAGLCLATSLLFGWLPAARFSRPLITTVLKDEAGAGGVRVGRVHRLTAALQVAISVPALVLSGMSLDRVRATATADLGFEADLLYAAPLALEAAPPGRAEFLIRTVSDTLAASGGVASVTVADGLPLDFRYRMMSVSLQAGGSASPDVVSAHVTRVGDGYLNTMGIPLLRGRSFTTEDRAGSDMVAIVSKALAGELFAGADISQALGHRLVSRDGERQQVLTIVGVTDDFPTSQMSTERAQLLLPLAQHPDVRRDSVRVSDDRGGVPRLMLVARSAAGEQPARLKAAFDNALRQLGPSIESVEVTTGVRLRQNSMDDFLTQAAVGGITGGVILLLSALGIYGVVGLMVATRTREIAVRVALGASRRRVLRMILFDVVKLVAPGVAIGLLITAAIARLNTGISLSSLEPLAYVAGATIAVLVAVASGFAPARRAASVQPMVAMRSE